MIVLDEYPVSPTRRVVFYLAVLRKAVQHILQAVLLGVGIVPEHHHPRVPESVLYVTPSHVTKTKMIWEVGSGYTPAGAKTVRKKAVRSGWGSLRAAT